MKKFYALLLISNFCFADQLPNIVHQHITNIKQLTNCSGQLDGIPFEQKVEINHNLSAAEQTIKLKHDKITTTYKLMFILHDMDPINSTYCDKTTCDVQLTCKTNSCINLTTDEKKQYSNSMDFTKIYICNNNEEKINELSNYWINLIVMSRGIR